MIVVERSHAHARLCFAVFVVSKTGGDAGILKRAFVLVVIQNARRRIASYIDVGPAVIVIIERQNAQGVMPLCFADAGWLAHIGECAVAVDRKSTRLNSSHS